MASEALSQLRSGKTSVRELVERVLREGKLQAVSLCFGELVRSGEEKSLTAGLWNICT